MTITRTCPGFYGCRATLNLKNERNGAEPKATKLVVCDGMRRHGLADFEHLAVASPSAERREQLEHVQLPAKRSLTATQKDALYAAILRCAIESKGGRLEADFSLCCAAIERGLSQEELRSQVSETGKFKECGRDYFDRTWEAAVCAQKK